MSWPAAFISSRLSSTQPSVAQSASGLASFRMLAQLQLASLGEESGINRGERIERWTGVKKANWCAGVIG